MKEVSQIVSPRILVKELLKKRKVDGMNQGHFISVVDAFSKTKW